MSDGPTLIQSVQRALRLLEIVAEHQDRAQAKEVARAAGLPLATTYHLLRTCVHEGWLQRLDDGSYVLGHRIDVVREHGTAARGVAHARPALEWLRDAIGGPVYLGRYLDGEVVIADIVDSRRARRLEVWVGVHDAAHATALGKSILGQLPPGGRDDYFDRHPLHPFTARTVVDRRRLFLPGPGQVAVDDGEWAVGVACLAGAVRAPTGPGAVAVAVSPAAVHRPATRHALLAGASRVSRALAIGSGLA
jgi:IclR family acetate operon transcriptional repressor